MKMNIEAREKFIIAAKSLVGNKPTISRSEIQAVVKKHKLPFPNWLTIDKRFRVGRGQYLLQAISKNIPNVSTTKVRKHKEKTPVIVATVPMTATVPIKDETKVTVENMNLTGPIENHLNLVPRSAEGYVPFGHFKDLKKIVDSKIFYPIYITGLSGNGKTMMVEQIHAVLDREVIRVNVTIETDEDDLIGGFRLINGQTVWQNGPVVIAMERGATLLLDEVDLGSNKLMCLQPVLEGKGIFIKKINKFISPAHGFNVIATANTKGKGSDDGRFMGTNVMNEAFLERFSITMEQEYPQEKIEREILNNVLKANETEDEQFTAALVMWAAALRDTYKAGGITELISTRRLVHICQAYSIFNGDRLKAITLCVARFDDETRESMLGAYEKIDGVLNGNNSIENSNLADPMINDPTIPF